jgi:type I restriction enzyme S subunit
MSRYQAYPEYKGSGLQWLGKMPSHWFLRKSKYVFSRVQREVRPEDGVVTAFRDGQVTLRSNRRMDGFTESIKEIGYQGVRKGDLLVHAMDGFAGAIGVSDSDGKCSPVCSVCVPTDSEKIHISYFGYLVRQLAITDFISSLAKGIRERSTEFRYSEFSVLDLALPPQNEQVKIATFLDYETAKIDALIEKQQRLIELIKEKRQAIISHAVTKGLNPNAPMKDSGVDWLGEVPAHWGIKKLKFLCDLQTGDKNTEDAVADGLYPFFVRSQSVERLNSFTADCEAVLTAGDGAGVGKVFHYFEGKFDFHQRVYMMNNFRAVSGKFFFHYLAIMFHKVALDGGAKSTVDSLRMPIFMNFQITVPIPEEQIEIIKFIDVNNQKFDSLSERASDAIQLLVERRTALISAAVTGKIDVRDWQLAAAQDEVGVEC